MADFLGEFSALSNFLQIKMSAKVEETGENNFRKSQNLDQMKYQHMALLLNKQDEEVQVNEETVRKCAINKVNSIINCLPGQRQELEMRKRVLMNTHIRAVNNQVKAVEKADKREVGNNFFVATQGVQAKSARPEPSYDSDSESSDSASDSDSDLSDSDLSDPEAIADKARGCYNDFEVEQNELANKSEFESEIETALKGCSIGVKKISLGGKAAKKTVGLKRKKPRPASEHQPILERMQKEDGSPPKCKRIRSHA